MRDEKQKSERGLGYIKKRKTENKELQFPTEKQIQESAFIKSQKSCSAVCI